MSYEQPAPSYAAYPPTNYGSPTVGMPMQDINNVKDYLAWSIVNLCCGFVVGGILPLIFSIICRNNKNTNNYSGAQSMSTLALVFNIIITILGGLGWLGMIIGLALAAATAAAVIPH